MFCFLIILPCGAHGPTASDLRVQIYRHVILAETIGFLLISFETGYHYVADAGLEYLVFLLQDPEKKGGWGGLCMSHHAEVVEPLPLSKVGQGTG